MKFAILKNRNMNKFRKMNMMFIMLYKNTKIMINYNYLYHLI